MKYGFIYLRRDSKHKKFYIGSHWGKKNDGYICSSTNMRENYKNRKSNFKRRILKKVYTNRQELLVEEQRWLDMIKPEEFGIKYYNISRKAGQGYLWINEETKKQVIKKRLDTMKQRHYDYVYWNRSKKGIPSHMKDKKHSAESLLKMSLAHKGKTTYFSQFKGKQLPQTICEKIRIAHMGMDNRSEGWNILYPNGQKIIINNLAMFCRQNNLSSGCMNLVASGTRKQHKGFKCSKVAA